MHYVHRGPAPFDFDGRKFLVAHGDEFDLANRKFCLIRSIFHSRLCQILYASIHPRWTVGLAHAWSLHSRRSGLKRHQVRPTPRGCFQRIPRALRAVEYTSRHPSDAPDFFIFGHRHILLDHSIGAARVLILGDWISFSYAEWDGHQLTLKQTQAPYTN